MPVKLLNLIAWMRFQSSQDKNIFGNDHKR